MQLLQYSVERAQPNYWRDEFGKVAAMQPSRPDRTRVCVWFAWDELVPLFEPRNSAEVQDYVIEIAYLDRAYPIDVEFDRMARGYRIAGTLDCRRGYVDTVLRAILPRGESRPEQPAPSGDVGVAPATVQPVAKPARRRLHL